MKKTLLIIVAAMMTLSACSSYTCPTYSKAKVKQEPVKQTRI